MKAMEKDWYQKNWTLDIQNMSWVEDTNRQVDFLIKQLHLKGTEKILDLALCKRAGKKRKFECKVHLSGHSHDHI